jgi:hypothetical protein
MILASNTVTPRLQVQLAAQVLKRLVLQSLMSIQSTPLFAIHLSAGVQDILHHCPLPKITAQHRAFPEVRGT